MARTKNTPQRTLEEMQGVQSVRADISGKVDVVKEKAFSATQARTTTSLPSWTRFPLLLVMNSFLSSALYSVATRWIKGELASVSKKDDGWILLAGLLGWRVAELALGWFGEYDSYDLLSLVILSHASSLHLLTTFYNVSSSTIIISMVINGLATYIPFRLLRPVSPAHQIIHDPKPNEAISADYSIKTTTTILAALIYSTTLYASYNTFLPSILVTYFNDIPTVVAAHTSTAVTILPANLLLGLAAHSFIFTPAVILAQKPAHFDPVTATLAETIWYNLWGWSKRTKAIIKRTAILATVVGVNGVLQTWGTIEGVEAKGAVIYSSVWVAGSVFTGLVFAVVANA